MKFVNLWAMSRVETIEEFYNRQFGWLPDNLRSEIWHFNVFRLEPFAGENAQPIPYKRLDYFKVMLVIGNSEVTNYCRTRFAGSKNSVEAQPLVCF